MGIANESRVLRIWYLSLHPLLLVFDAAIRLVSADSLGMMSVWDIFPDTRRLHTIQGHSDSVQARFQQISPANDEFNPSSRR